MASNTGAGEKHPCSGQDDGGAGTPPVKRARLIQPDVTVVVGGTEFHHYSQILCNVSDYFDAALNSGKPTARLEFPDKDPADWEMLLPLFSGDPHASLVEITADNVEKIAEWSLLLGIDWLHEKCDKFYSIKKMPGAISHWRWRGYRHRVGDMSWTRCPLSDSIECEMDEHGVMKCLGMKIGDQHASAVKAELQRMIETLQCSTALSLSASKKRAAKHVRDVITKFPEALDQPIICLLVSVFKGDIDTIQEVWGSLKPFIPDTLKEIDPPSLCCNVIFPHVFFAQLSQMIKNRQATRACQDEWEEKTKNLKNESEEKEKELKDLKKAVVCLPDRLHQYLPATRSIPKKYNSKEKFNEIGRNMLRRVIADDLGYKVDIPEDRDDRSDMIDELSDSSDDE